jgi:hypothetical protein
MRRAGADLADVQALLGHKSPKTTARHAEVSVDKVMTAVQRMERGWNEARVPNRRAVEVLADPHRKIVSAIIAILERARVHH